MRMDVTMTFRNYYKSKFINVNVCICICINFSHCVCDEVDFENRTHYLHLYFATIASIILENTNVMHKLMLSVKGP